MARYGIRTVTPHKLNELKRDILLFDHIVFDAEAFNRMCPMTSAALVVMSDRDRAQKQMKSIDFIMRRLIDANILVESAARKIIREHLLKIDRDPNDPESVWLTLQFNNEEDSTKEETAEIQNLLSEYVVAIVTEEEAEEKSRVFENVDSFINEFKLLESRGARDIKLLSLLQRYSDSDNLYVPMLPLSELAGSNQLLRQREVTRIVIESFPAPVDNTPWQRVLEFRDDPTNRLRVLTLRQWISKVASAHASTAEAGEELDYLRAEHEEALKLHRMKYEQSTIELVVTATMEALEDLAKFRWGSAASRLFAIRRAKVDFLAGERNLPGREVAYLTNVAENFPKR